MDGPFVTLAGGITLPMVGYGTYHLSERQTLECVSRALEVGYRHIDCAERYRNQHIVGEALRRSEVPRKDITLTSKVWWDHLGYDEVIATCERTLNELQTDYLDLFLVHWPNRLIPPTETFGALEALIEAGQIRGYGVSNYTAHHLDDVLANSYTPVINQVEVHPSFRQDALISACWERGVAVVAHSPLGGGNDLSLHELGEVATIKGITRAEVVLAWHRQRGIPVVVGAQKFTNIDRNLASLSVTLTDVEMASVDRVMQRDRVISKPWADFEY